jgi:hypothetical protein
MIRLAGIAEGRLSAYLDQRGKRRFWSVRKDKVT